MKKLTKIGVASVFRISLVLCAAIGLVVGLLLFIDDVRKQNLALGFVTLLLGPILYGLLGACINAALAWLYNRLAERLGGIELTFED
jgi:hypothetical protein